MSPVENKDRYKAALIKWKKANNIPENATGPAEKPKFQPGENALDYAKRLAEWNIKRRLWDTAPKPEDFDLLDEHTEIRIDRVLRFGAHHTRLFDFFLLTELNDFQDFLIKQGIKYSCVKKENEGTEVNIDKTYDFVFSEKAARFNLTVSSSDNVHITGFHFYNESGYKSDTQRISTIAEIQDFFIRDKRVITKKVKQKNDSSDFTQEYITPFDVALVQDDHIYITTIKEYDKLQGHKRLPINKWVKWVTIISLISIAIYFGFLMIGSSSKQEAYPAEETDEIVYICTGPNATKYHVSPYCRWLGNCSGEIDKITAEEAQRQGRTACKGCLDD